MRRINGIIAAMWGSAVPFFFIQLSDPQFGSFEARGAAPGDGIFPETALYQRVHRRGQPIEAGPVGFPLGDDLSGLRVVKVYDDRIEHEYFGMDDVPTSVTL